MLGPFNDKSDDVVTNHSRKMKSAITLTASLHVVGGHGSRVPPPRQSENSSMVHWLPNPMNFLRVRQHIQYSA